MTPDEYAPDSFPFSRVGVAAWDHPLYIVLGHILVKMFPRLDPLWLVNLISAVCGAASVLLIFLISYRYTQSILAACYASLALVVSHTFWWHSSTPEVYTLFVFLLLVSFSFFDQFERTGKRAPLLYSAFFLGLAACTHILAFLVIPALVLYSLLSGRYRNLHAFDVQKLALSAAGFLAGFSLYIVQFIRMSANFSFRDIMGPMVGSTFLSRRHSLRSVGESLAELSFFLTVVQFLRVDPRRWAFAKHSKKGRLLRKIVSFSLCLLYLGSSSRADQFTFFVASYIFWPPDGGSEQTRLVDPVKPAFAPPHGSGVISSRDPIFLHRSAAPGSESRFE
jgi:hypothetical protein